MRDRYLIDGYNLLHALQGPPAGPHGLEPARRRLLDRLLELPRVEASYLHVVFDAQHALANGTRETYHRGIRLQFSHGCLADDLIEQLVQQDHDPKTLVVVSNDRRVQEAARRNSCRHLGCLDWVDLMKQPPAQARAERAEKPEFLGRTEEWLQAFEGIDTTDLDDPRPFLR